MKFDTLFLQCKYSHGYCPNTAADDGGSLRMLLILMIKMMIVGIMKESVLLVDDDNDNVYDCAHLFSLHKKCW